MMFLPQDPAARAGLRARDRTRRRRRGAGAAGLARRARRQPRAWARASRQVEPVIRQVFVGRGALHAGRRRVRAQALRHPQELGPRHPGARAAARQGVLRAVVLGAHARLQGHAAGQPGRRVLPRSARPGAGVGAGHGAPALLHQHLSHLGPGAPVPPHRPQRRDQHPARQRELDPRAPAEHRSSKLLGEDLDKIWPLIYDGQSDSASFDNALELLCSAATRWRTR